MAVKSICFKDYIECKDDKKLSKTRKKINRKRKDGSSKNVYGWGGYGPPSGISGGTADAAADGGAAGGVGESVDVHRLGYKAPPPNEKSKPPRLNNTYKNGNNDMNFLDYLKDENEPSSKEVIDDEPYEDKDDIFDKDTWNVISELLDDGLSLDDIADDTDMSIEDVEAYIAHFEDDGEDEDIEDDELEDDDVEDAFQDDLGDEKVDDEEFEKMFQDEEDDLEDEDFEDEDFEDEDEEEGYDKLLATFNKNRERTPDPDNYMLYRDDEFDYAASEFDNTDIEDELPPDEIEDIDLDFEDEEAIDIDDDAEYADEIQVGSWTIRRIDDDDDDDDYGDDDYGDADLDDEIDAEFAEEDAEEPSKKDQARALYRAMRSGEYSRKDIIASFEKRLGLSPSSSTAYYERIAKEYGETESRGQNQMDPGVAGGMGMGDMSMGNMASGEGESMEDEGPEFQDPQDWEDPHRQGVIRNVKNAHLVFKRQSDDGSFEELWIYKEGEKFQDQLDIRRDILAGTDIPVEKTSSPDNSQKVETWSVGDVQYLNVTGLPN